MLAPALPTAGPLSAETIKSAGGEIANDSELDVPPPGGGVNTLTCTVPTAARSVDGIAAWSVPVSTTVVGRLAPFHITFENASNPLPVTVNVSAPVPATALDGDSAVSTGTGLFTVVSVARAWKI